jgi:Uma2 family endonuclease
MAQPEEPMAIASRRRRFTVEEYHRLGEAGILREDDRVELIDGEIIEMTPIGERHALSVIYLNNVLARGLEGRALVSPRNPLRLGPHSEPLPDLVLLPSSLNRFPCARDALLVIEVADTSLAYDRDTKLPRYARAGIPEAWIVDLEGHAVEVHRTPGPTGYGDVRRLGRGAFVSPAAFPDLRLAVDEILGPAR